MQFEPKMIIFTCENFVQFACELHTITSEVPVACEIYFSHANASSSYLKNLQITCNVNKITCNKFSSIACEAHAFYMQLGPKMKIFTCENFEYFACELHAINTEVTVACEIYFSHAKKILHIGNVCNLHVTKKNLHAINIVKLHASCLHYACTLHLKSIFLHAKYIYMSHANYMQFFLR